MAFQRAVPRGQWAISGLLAVILALVVITGWEFRVRGQGYSPSLNDTSDRWAQIRSRVGGESGQTVIVGSSRIMFDFDLDTYASHFGVDKPLQLAMPGTNPLCLLEHVAQQEDFDGILILGVAPGLWFVPEGLPVYNANQAIGRYDNWSPSQKIGLVFAGFLQTNLAFIEPDDLALGALLKRLGLPDRPGAVPNLLRCCRLISRAWTSTARSDCGPTANSARKGPNSYSRPGSPCSRLLLHRPI